jgi:hypothetical protein
VPLFGYFTTLCHLKKLFSIERHEMMTVCGELKGTGEETVVVCFETSFRHMSEKDWRKEVNTKKERMWAYLRDGIHYP